MADGVVVIRDRNRRRRGQKRGPVAELSGPTVGESVPVPPSNSAGPSGVFLESLHNDYSAMKPHHFEEFLRSGAEVLLNLEPTLMNRTVLEQIKSVARKAYPHLRKSAARQLIESGTFVKGIQPEHDLHINRVLCFLDALETYRAT